MRIKTNIGLWICTLGVLMFLLRPYMIYQLTAKDRAVSGTFGLLQQSVKKKEDLHAYLADALNTIEQHIASITPLRKVIVSLLHFLLIFSKPADKLFKFTTIPFSALSRHRYALTSCLLI